MWKSRTECAFNGSGYEQILSSKEYAESHQMKNQIVYSQLAVALVDGTAYHIVKKHDEKKHGHLAWKSLCTWYDGDEVKTEAAENARSKLELLTLHSGVTASDYVNKFMNYFRYLEKIPGEEYSANHAVAKFLDNITDRSYESTVSFCRNNNCDLETCVYKVRMNERNIMRKRANNLKLRGIVRRMQAEKWVF